ncbi:MAG TPA: hypothetical protein VIZ17_00850 [Acetobacteraceae bacterium]
MRGGARGNDDEGAFPREGDRDGAADALAGAGYDGNFSGEPGGHVVSFLRRIAVGFRLRRRVWLVASW